MHLMTRAPDKAHCRRVEADGLQHGVVEEVHHVIDSTTLVHCTEELTVEELQLAEEVHPSTRRLPEETSMRHTPRSASLAPDTCPTEMPTRQPDHDQRH
eukprot:8571863-Heterocapsa_arctica.AAC.1